jgi:lipopolysaccharide/colanic/teichoic acid biosynthesis glycosyltransferase
MILQENKDESNSIHRTTSSQQTSSPIGVLQPDSWYVTGKVVIEFTLALGLFVLSVPVILVAAILVKLTSRGPAFYSQTRVGRNGVPFRLFKIRTMIHNCESVSGPQWSIPQDPRVTLLGRVLRRTHLDELPQLWNVLRGEMSLVGPRPERPEFVPRLTRALPHYTDRLLVRPGVTGLAQVQLPADTDLASVRRKLACDLYYVRHVSFLLDIRIILCTVVEVFGVPFHVVGWVAAVPSRSAVERVYEVRLAEAAVLTNLEPSQ